MKSPHARLIVMSKAPVRGRVKTRLIPLLGEAGAMSLHQALLEETLAKLSRAGLCPVELCCAPDVRHAYFADARSRFSLTLSAQSDGDLGRRMSTAIRQGLQQAREVVLVGTDCPDLAPADVAAALALLAAGNDVVLGPSRDGGYYLIAMRAHHPALFEDIPWGSDRVMALTRQRISACGLTCAMLDVREDIDTPADYQAWQQRVAPVT